jgi:hypothetical protein
LFTDPVRRISFVTLVNTVFPMHSHILYRLKIDSTKSATFQEAFDLLRITAREILSPPFKLNNQGIARLALEWVLLPVWILYLFVWEGRFRKQLFSNRANGRYTLHLMERALTLDVVRGVAIL